jgi:serine/threonine protein kinase
METIVAGTVVDAGGGARKAVSALERLVADDDGMIRENRPFTVGAKIAEGDTCDLYECTDQAAVLKICRKTSDNDLMDAERTALDAIYPPGTKEEKFYRYLPHIVAGFEWRGHRAHVLPIFRDYVSLDAVLKAYPKGIDFRDWAWMFRRTLEGIGFVHQKGFVHGSLIPAHILVHPVNHGARLIDWCYSKPLGDPLQGIPQAYQDFYPPEVFARGSTSVSTDLYVAAKTSIALLGGDPRTNSLPTEVPVKLKDFLIQSLSSNPDRRPKDAWSYRDELGQLLRELVGEPTYREFRMPS